MMPQSGRSLGPGVLLDRDGTIIVDYGYVGSVERVELIDGAAEAIAKFNRAGLPVAVVTNQSGVARGYYTADDVDLVHKYIAGRLEEHGAHIDMFIFCPYHADGVIPSLARFSADRKPGPGMAQAAAAALGIDLTKSWVVGDRPEDMGLAKAIGSYAAFVGSGTYQDERTWTFPSLGAAAPFIIERASS